MQGRQAGFHHSEEAKIKMRTAKLGKKMSKEFCIHNAISHTGLRQSSETIQKRILKTTGKKRTVEARQKMSSSGRGKHSGESNGQWRGGCTGNYTKDWPIISKREIAIVEGVCCWPGCVTKATVTHHINGNKQENRRVNLLPLCKQHHGRGSSKRHLVRFELECLEIQRLRGILK
jgi:hypothetical protein